MLNKLIEQSRHKCARYWPEKVNEPMLVTHQESDKLYFTVTLEGTITFKIERILTEHIYEYCRVLTKLQIMYICSVRIWSYLRDIILKKGTASSVTRVACVTPVAPVSARTTTSACASWRSTFKWSKVILRRQRGNVRGAFMPSAMRLIRMIANA